MDQIKFINMHDRYSLDSATSEVADILGLFLSDDVGGRPLKWLGWVNGFQSSTSSNISCLWKDDKYVYIEFLYAEDDNEIFFKTTKERFIKMLYDWDTLIKQKPNHIYIAIHEDGDIALEGSND